MATKQIVIHVGEQEVTLTLHSVSKRDGIRRAVMMSESRDGEMKDRLEIEKGIAFFKYPTCICAVKEPEEYVHLPFDRFLDVDEQDMDAWEAAAYELNPQWARAWKLMADMTEQDEKKLSTSEDGSSAPTPQPATTTSQPSTN